MQEFVLRILPISTMRNVLRQTGSHRIAGKIVAMAVAKFRNGIMILESDIR